MPFVRRVSAAALVLAAGFTVASADEKKVADEKKTEVKAAAKTAVATPAIRLGGAPANPAEKLETTHKVSAAIDVKGKSGLRLQTLCLDSMGRVVGLVATPKPFGGPVKGAAAEVQVFDADGKPLHDFKVDFHGMAVNAGPDGSVFVAGDGKIAKFDKDGKQVGKTAELPFVAELLKDTDALKAKAEAQLKREKEQFAQSIGDAKKQFTEQIKKLEEKKKEDRTKAEERQIDQFKKLVEQYDSMEKEQKSRTVEQVLADMTGRVRVTNGIAVSDKDVFVACGDMGGYGYAVWRLSHDLKDPKQVLSGIGGCCGQMDIQCHGPDVLVAENTKKQFARYDREGKKLGGYGKGGADTDPACFGGCCNPMNVRASGTGDVYTAESEGIIKRFSPSGAFLETTGVVKLTGGCKNVAVGVNADASKLYFLDQPGSKFHILEKKAK